VLFAGYSSIPQGLHISIVSVFDGSNWTYLIQVDNWLPEVVALLVEISHTDLSEVTWMVLVHVGSVVMLTTSKTTTTWMLAVLSYTTVTGGNVSAAVKQNLLASIFFNLSISCSLWSIKLWDCDREFVWGEILPAIQRLVAEIP
jgi:hypothetical protein